MEYEIELELILSPEMIRRDPHRWRWGCTFRSSRKIDAKCPETALNVSVKKQNEEAVRISHMSDGGLWVYKAEAYQSPREESAKPLAVYESEEARDNRFRENDRAIKAAYEPSY